MKDIGIDVDQIVNVASKEPGLGLVFSIPSFLSDCPGH